MKRIEQIDKIDKIFKKDKQINEIFERVLQDPEALKSRSTSLENLEDWGQTVSLL